jgi:hypothetical protein
MRRIRTALALVAAALFVSGLAMLFAGGLLIEPVSVRAEAGCQDDGAAHPCALATCIFENQGPVPTRGSVVLDVWTVDPADEQGVRRLAAARRRHTLALRPGEREPIREPFPGVPYLPGRTMVRCMPWYAAPRLQEHLSF